MIAFSFLITDLTVFFVLEGEFFSAADFREGLRSSSRSILSFLFAHFDLPLDPLRSLVEDFEDDDENENLRDESSDNDDSGGVMAV